MSFYDTLVLYRNLTEDVFQAVSTQDVQRAINAHRPQAEDFLALLSPAAEGLLETMAQKAREMTLRFFGKTIQLYAPLYVSDFCENCCLYCGFSARNRFKRKKLALTDVEREASFIAASGLRHVLLLTGESQEHSPVAYIRDCITVLKSHFSAISVEVYPLTEREYTELIFAGCDGLTIYQETYDETVYQSIHPAGPKRNFRFRLDAPERGCKSGMNHVQIGALLGLSDWKKDLFLAGLHAGYLQDLYPDVEISMAVPRLKPHLGNFQSSCPVTDKNLVQAILALRLFLPRGGISISTREPALLRDHLILLGITRMSAGSVTRVGGYASTHGHKTYNQFDVSDDRSVTDIIDQIRTKGYDPVLKDWTYLA